MVRLEGLKNIKFNGQFGKIMPQLINNDGRYTVELCGEDRAVNHDQEIRVKQENLALACHHCFIAAGKASMQYCGKCRVASYCNVEC